jgi:iron(II)-dependent oxidoreductase
VLLADGVTIAILMALCRYTPPPMPSRPTDELIPPGALPADEVRRHLDAARERLLVVTGDLDGERLLGPRLTIVNPPLWEIGHVAWFQEHWCLRMRSDGSLAPSRLENADGLYDSTAIAHDRRWTLPLPSLAATRGYLAAVLDEVRGALARRPDDVRLRYFAELAACHEDMHGEAFHYTRQTLGYPAPALAERAMPAGGGAAGDVALRGGSFHLGAARGAGFVHDNEKWSHVVEVRPFRIARTAVTNREFAAFVDAGGYARREWWTEAGWAWRESRAAAAPQYWRRQGGEWTERRFDRWQPLAPDEPVVHVAWYEAQAYCRFASRRLPTEAEWEYAACDGEDTPKPATPWRGERASAAHANLEGAARAPVGAFANGDTPSGCRQLFGNVWEWTADAFAPYPGFVADPYKEYSAPWFGTHKVLRGGSFATPARLLRTTWRNFYTPDRYDVFAGFRTCAA